MALAGGVRLSIRAQESCIISSNLLGRGSDDRSRMRRELRCTNALSLGKTEDDENQHSYGDGLCG